MNCPLGKALMYGIMAAVVGLALRCSSGKSTNDRNSKDDSDPDISSVNLPAGVSGVNLVDPDNAAVSATFGSDETFVASLMVKNPSTGKRVAASGLAANTKVSWNLVAANGTTVTKTNTSLTDANPVCTLSADSIQFACSGVSVGSFAKVFVSDAKTGKQAELVRIPPKLSSAAAIAQGDGSYAVTITGSGFSTDSAPEVVYADQTCGSVTSATETKINCLLPSGAPGSGALVVTNSDGTAASSKTLLTLPPARLSAFAVTGGASAGSLSITWTYRTGATGTYTSLSLRRTSGSTAPTSCTAGTLATTVTDFATTSFSDSGTAGTQYSYLVCITGPNGTTAADSATGTATAGTCSGYSAGGGCWYLGATNASCDSTCSTHGGADLASTRDYVGSGAASIANCQSLVQLLAGQAVSTLDGGSCGPGGVGCYYIAGLTQAARCTASTTVTSTAYTAQRLCSCIN